ncbi:hypothetical protein DICVIV_00291 [Dictyocaulus viviparus]|uniref:Uncharacterized protein n=1 Tax=Dictyocaulus viviparus TaxID=29172 RepID=A0A0D8YFW1_DICVI|nr:hypothetical protein DICVIV_00291 [Dictyocaulus viviparus]
MDSFAILNEEVFKHLCSLAIDKVSDKAEKRKAGCGGVAMRKRLLIKNFVNDLCRKKAEDEELGGRKSDFKCDYVEGNSELTSCDSSNSTPCTMSDEELDDGDVMIPYDDVNPAHDIWLDSAAVPDDTMPSEILTFDSLHSGMKFNFISSIPRLPYSLSPYILILILYGRDGAIGRLDDKACDSRISLYSLYSSMSESADDGDEALSACDPTESLLRNCLYNCVHSFDSSPLSPLYINGISPISESTNSSPIQPNPDFSTSTHVTCSVATKRRSDECLLYDSISSEIGHQKKIKL